MLSIWKKELCLEERGPLVVDEQCDVCVIGAGLVGILTAYRLQVEGLNVIVLEADRIASGQTGHTTAKITSQHGLIYKKMIDDLGYDLAKQYADANQWAIEEYQRIIQVEQIDCNFERISTHLYSHKNIDKLKEEESAALELELPARYFETETFLHNEKAMLEFENQAQFQPLKFVRHIAEELRIYEKTPVDRVEGNTVYSKYAKIEAKHIVFATHFPFINVPGFYFTKLHQERSYVVAYEDPKPQKKAYIGIDEDGLSMRWYNNILLLGKENHRTGENSLGGRFDAIRAEARAYFPEAKEVGYWSAQDCMSLDGIPYIGKYSDNDDPWYVATGFNKWGMTTSMVASVIIADKIVGRNNEFAEVFDPSRSQLSSAPEFIENTMQSIKGLSRQFLMSANWNAEELERGHGGVVELGNEKVGVYKNDEGEIFAVSVKCPHLGCQLEFNPDELSWDCPCHGSRFDIYGNILDNPAQTNIKLK